MLQYQGVIFTSIVFSPDGRQIAMSSEFGLKYLQKTERQHKLLQENIVGSETSIERTSEQDIPKLNAGFVDRTVEVTLPPVYSPDGNEILVGAANFAVLRYSTHSGVESPSPLVGHDGIVTCMAYSL